MESRNDPGSGTAQESRPAPSQPVPAEARDGSATAPADRAAPLEPHAVAPPLPATARPAHPWRKWLLLAAVVVALAVGGSLLVPWVITALNTISTDDAYVNGHVTFVAPRVAGQVSQVLVDDNMRVAKGRVLVRFEQRFFLNFHYLLPRVQVTQGDVLVRLDKEPFQVQVAIKKAAVQAAKADLVAAEAQVQGLVAQTRANRFKLEHAIEEVNNQIALLRSSVAAYESKKATLSLAQANLKRGEELVTSGGISKEALDERRQAVKVAQAAVEQALQQIYALRVGLGLPERPAKGDNLADHPDDLDQNFSSVRQALGQLLQSGAQLGYFPTSWNSTPKQAIHDFYQQDPKGNLDRIYARIIPRAPAIQQAKAKLEGAQRDLEQAELNLRYCDIVAEIDGVVTRRNVNPGDNVAVGQNLMAIRSLREIWVDANFKETQLADLRIGQRARLEVDMYGRRREFEGRITGFTMGTGSTLALLPPENATGNFVKIVQRLPVRIEFTNYDADNEPLFVGLSVVPYVYYKEPPTGPNAGKVLQPVAPLPTGPNVENVLQPSSSPRRQGPNTGDVVPPRSSQPKGPNGPYRGSGS